MPEAGRIILDILVILVAAKLGGEIAERLGQPAVLGELAVGVVVGPSVLGFIDGTPVIEAMAQLGAILLLFEVGLETDLTRILQVGPAALRVATVGVVLPFALGAVLALALGHHGIVAVLIGATLTATSVGITARVLSDLHKLDTDEGRTVLAAAVLDDVMGLVILTVVSGLAAGQALSALSVGRIIAAAGGFLLLALLVGLRVSPPMFRWISKRVRVRGILITAAFSFCLLLAVSAELFGLAPIVGAFVAGVLLATTEQHQQIRERLTPLADVFIPIFFLSMGIQVQIGAFSSPALLTLAGSLTLVAVAGKVVAGWAAPSSMSRAAIGFAMVPRGEVGLIFASFGLARGLLRPDLYSAMLLVVALTTFLTPPLVKRLFESLRPARGRQAGKLVLPRRPLVNVPLGTRW
ncbi:MAG: cation:proton antiporter [Actinomycetota bacterium]